MITTWTVKYSQAASMVYESQMPPQANNKWTFTSKTLMLGKIEDRRRRGWQRMRWLDSIIDSMDMSLSKLQEIMRDMEAWHVPVHSIAKSRTQLSNSATTAEVMKSRLGPHRSHPPLPLTHSCLAISTVGPSLGSCSSLGAKRSCCHVSYWVGIHWSLAFSQHTPPPPTMAWRQLCPSETTATRQRDAYSAANKASAFFHWAPNPDSS